MPPAAKKKKSKKPLVISLAAALVLALAAVGAFAVPEMLRSNAYDQAMEQFEMGNYAQAHEEFLALEDYLESASWARISNDYVRFEEAVALYDKGEFAKAKDAFTWLERSSISGIDEWISKCEYGIAENLYAAGDLTAAIDAFQALGSYQDSELRVKQCRYERAEGYLEEGELEKAYNAFIALGSFEDSAERAAACHFPFPATGILYQDPGFYYDMSALEINYNYSTGGSYFKIYSGETLVVTLFLNANSSVLINLAPGSYIVKEGTGDRWYGEDLAFGTKGSYTTMIYDDSGNEYLTLEHNVKITLTMNASDNPNVKERNESLSSF